MRYSRKDLLQLPDHHLEFDERIEFDEDTYKKFPRIRKLRNVEASGDGDYDPADQRLYLNLHVTGTMTCPCDITSEDVDLDFDSEADEVISFNRKDFDNIEILQAEGEYIELLPIIFRQILVEVPITVVKPGIIDYPKGDGWEVMDEATYQKNKAGKVNPALAALKDYIPQDE